MTGIILAGGKNSRMKGQDKAFIKLKGIPLIKRQIKLLRGIFKRIIVVTNNPGNYKFKGIKVVKDIVPHRGPLSGIHAGLMESGSFYNFVVACDMPFLSSCLIQYMIDNKNDYDIIIPKIDGKVHPLFGIYAKDCIPVIEEALSQNKLKVSGIFPKLKSRFISKQEVEGLDRSLLSLENINTADDLARIKKLQEVKLCQRRSPR